MIEQREIEIDALDEDMAKNIVEQGCFVKSDSNEIDSTIDVLRISEIED